MGMVRASRSIRIPTNTLTLRPCYYIIIRLALLNAFDQRICCKIPQCDIRYGHLGAAISR